MYHIVRCWQRRRATAVDSHPDDDEVEVLPERPGRPWQSDTSDEGTFFVRSRDNETQVQLTMQDASVQTSTWQSYSSDELANEIAFLFCIKFKRKSLVL